MAPKKRKPDPYEDDPTVTKYKLFASSKREKDIKVKRAPRPKMEGDSTSPKHITNSQFSVVISDTESENEEANKADGMSPVAKAKKRALADEDEEDDDNDEDMAASEASSSRLPRGDNRARCSRGRGASSLQATSNGHTIKVSSFKPLVKNKATSSSKVNDSRSLPKQQIGTSNNMNGKRKANESTSKAEKAEKKVEKAIAERGAEKSPSKMFRGVSDSEEEEEEFHEPAELRRSVSAGHSGSRLDEAQADKSPGKEQRGIEEKDERTSELENQKASESAHQMTSEDLQSNTSESTDQEMGEDLQKTCKEVKEDADDDEDDDHIDSVLGQAIPSRDSSTSALETHQYITREEHEKAIQNVREEMKQELDRLKTSMRIEIKRLVRTEVKDEIELSQQR